MLEQLKSVATILRRQQVQSRTGLARTTIYDKLDVKSGRHDPSFPRQIKIGSNSVGWLESEIEAWIQSRVNFSRIEMGAK